MEYLFAVQLDEGYVEELSIMFRSELGRCWDLFLFGHNFISLVEIINGNKGTRNICERYGMNVTTKLKFVSTKRLWNLLQFFQHSSEASIKSQSSRNRSTLLNLRLSWSCFYQCFLQKFLFSLESLKVSFCAINIKTKSRQIQNSFLKVCFYLHF